MKLTLYRQWEHLPLGWHPTLHHSGIRTDRYFENFEETARYHNIDIKFSNNISECNLVVFNLDRIDSCENINPVYLIDEQIWDQCKELKIPVIFWFAGECHPKSSIMFSAAERRVGQRIWWVDSNAYTTDDRHIFFDNTDLPFQSISLYRRLYPHPVPTINKIDIATSSIRTDIHKLIVYNELKTYPGPKDLHYPLPVIEGNHYEYNSKYDDRWDRTTLPPLNCKHISDTALLNRKLETSVLIQVNTYITSPINSPALQMYITEKFRADFMLNKPIMPLGESGLVKHLAEQGFEFPDWIDYSYDSYKDVNDRLEHFFNAVMDLSKIPDLSDKSIKWQQTSTNALKAITYSSKQSFIDIINHITITNGK